MRNVRGIVAAALGGGATAALLVGVLASGAGGKSTALVTLQVAPRGPGIVTATPTSENDKDPCTAKEGQNDCEWRYERGKEVRLTAKADSGAGRSFFGWSEPQCGNNTACTVKLDDDLTTVVAVFSPLRLGVKFSDDDGGANVEADPAGKPCTKKLNDAVACFEYAPHTRVKLTVKPGSTPFRNWQEQGDYRCEPTNSTSCTITVEDEPTWAGARFGSDPKPEPQLPTTITVEFKVKKGGNGNGRVTAAKMDCGTVCTANYGYGRSITLTAAREEGSTFEGWNGVCAKTQTQCSFPVGPVTSITALFSRDATAPTVPGTLSVKGRTRTTIAIAWTASTDNVGVTGYRVYVNGVAAGDTTATERTLEGLKCGRSYEIAVDASDAVGNRSQRASVTVQTLACALAARLAGVSVLRAGANRIVSVQLRVNRTTTVKVTLLRSGKKVASGKFAAKPGTNALKLRVPKGLPGGQYRVSISIVNPDGGTLVFGRGVLLPRPG
jgi:fibronectin type III domain protein/List-Bact-rpt repeat protein